MISASLMVANYAQSCAQDFIAIAIHGVSMVA